MTHKNKVEEGDTFNAYVRKGEFSMTLGGEEGADQLAHCCPELAIKVNSRKVESITTNYEKSRFYFKVVKKWR